MLHVVSFSPFKQQTHINFRGQNSNNSRTAGLYAQNIGNDTFVRQNKPANTLKRGEILCNKARQKSWIFRDDIKWQNLSIYLKQRYENVNKINTYVYGCPEGKEPYTMSIMLQDEFKDEAGKFFPIIAKDISEEVIKNNIETQKSPVPIDKGFVRIKNALTNYDNIKEYIIPDKNPLDGYLTDKVRNKVQFSCANILEDIENIDNKSPSIIMCRNMWPYINNDEYQNFANKLYERLAPGSIVIIGHYDCEGEDGLPDTDKFPEALLEAGFDKPNPWLDRNTRNFNYYLIFEKNREIKL